MSAVRKAVVLSSALLLVASLVGCQSPVFNLRTGLEDGLPVFASCESSTGVDTILLTVDESTLWSATGEGDFEPTDLIVYGELPEGFVGDVGPLPFDATSSSFQFSLSGFHSGVSYSHVWIVDGTKLVEGKWLDQLGRLHDASC